MLPMAKGMGHCAQPTRNRSCIPVLANHAKSRASRHLTCPAENTTCPLCQHNPNRRCQLADNFAPKQLEKQPLLSCCGSSVRIGLMHCNNLWQEPFESCSSSRQASVQECEEICLEFSLLNGSAHDHWLRQGHEGCAMDDQSRLACEVLRSRKTGRQALLQGGFMSHRTPEHRIRVGVTNKPTVLVDLTVQENSEAQLGKDVQYKLLVRALCEHSGEEVAQLVSQNFSEFGFPSSNNSENSDSETSVIDAEPMVEMQLSMTGVQVTTMRSKGGLKPLIPCLDDPVTKLEGVGDKTRRNLLDVRACAAALPFPAALPEDCPNTVTTGLPSYPRELVECLEVRNRCPKLLTRPLLPEAATEHALRAVPNDSRARRWKPHPESQWELLYSCSRGQIDWSSPAAAAVCTVLVRSGGCAQNYEPTAAGQGSQQEAAKMAELADEAFKAWKREGHPGWSLDSMNSLCMQQLDQPQDRRLLRSGDTRHFQPASTSRPGFGRQLGSEGSSRQPQDTSANPAPLSAMSTFPAMNTTSSGSQGSASPTHSHGRFDRRAGATPLPRSSKRLAAKRAQHGSQDTSPGSPAQHSPEAQLRLSDILGLPLSGRQQGAPALPNRLSGQLGAVLGAQQPLQEGDLVRGSCKGPTRCSTQAADKLTLDQALESMNPDQNFPLGLQNPFEAAAGDSPWHLPSRAEGSQGVDGRASPCSALTGRQDQLALRSSAQGYSAAGFASLPLPEPLSLEDDPGFALELDLRCKSLEPEAKRGKWSVPNQQAAHSDEVSPVTCFPSRAAEQSKPSVGNSPMSRSRTRWHTAPLRSIQSVSASADSAVPVGGLRNQPCAQACGPGPSLARLLQPTCPFFKAHMAKRPELWGSSDLPTSVTARQDMAEEIRQQQQQSFECLLARQNL
ncbi:PSII 6.1 kDa protein [Trebouxia sp. C0009 RCD-2024]